MSDAQAEPPLFVEHDGVRWVRTEIRKGADLVDGTAWITEFQKKSAVLQQAAPKPGRRLLRQTVSCGDDPQFYASSGDAPLGVRNEVLKDMIEGSARTDSSRGPGKRVHLATGEDVIFWFNVGRLGPPRERVYVTDAFCPHQGLCLNTGELKDIEDVAGDRKAFVRCSRHNKTFDIKTGESPGNSETLRTYPVRFDLGHWYVGIGPATSCTGELQDPHPPPPEQDVEMLSVEPQTKRPKTVDEGAPRILHARATIV
jgi:nitrite reductase/ring-hydroxylating ferredoxin subunit